jgi:small subunit ribosomal protein S27e
MKKERIHIPKPRSNFLLIQCPNCGNEQIFFSSTTMDIKCKVCANILAEKTGGKAKTYGAALKRLD